MEELWSSANFFRNIKRKYFAWIWNADTAFLRNGAENYVSSNSNLQVFVATSWKKVYNNNTVLTFLNKHSIGLVHFGVITRNGWQSLWDLINSLQKQCCHWIIQYVLKFPHTLIFATLYCNDPHGVRYTRYVLLAGEMKAVVFVCLIVCKSVNKSRTRNEDLVR